jgi:xanthine permease
MTNERDLIYKLDGKPPLSIAIPLGLQHVLAMFIGNIAPIIVICGVLQIAPDMKAMMIQSAMLVAGLVTLVQLYPLGPIGARLPIVVGTSFAFMPSAIAVGKAYGFTGVLGSALVGSLAAVLFGIFIKPLRRFFPGLVTGVVLIAIGLNLMPVGANYFAGGANSPIFGQPRNFIVGFIVLTVIVLLQRFTKGALNLSAVIIALVVGYLVAIPMGLVDFSKVALASWVSIPKPFAFGALQFPIDGIIKFALIYIAVSLETIGNLSGITLAGENREATAKEMSGAILADGFGSAFAAVFNILPNTAYGQNAGIVAMTKVMNRFCVATGAVFLILAGLFPKLAAIFAAMPSAVLGGAVVMVFAMITISGMKMVVREGLGSRNTAILAIALGVGIGMSKGNVGALEHLPYAVKFVLEDPVIGSALIAVVLNAIFPKDDHGTDSEPSVDIH